MDPARILGRGVAFPPRLDGRGRWAWSAGEDNVRDSIRIILLTEPGERLRLPDFGAGLRRYLFEPNNTATRARMRETISRALGRWEPRIRVRDVTVVADPADPQQAVVTIAYELVATRVQERVQLQITVNG